MMSGWRYGTMMDCGTGGSVFGFFFILFWLVILIDLILLGLWLWKQLQRK